MSKLGAKQESAERSIFLDFLRFVRYKGADKIPGCADLVKLLNSSTDGKTDLIAVNDDDSRLRLLVSSLDNEIRRMGVGWKDTMDLYNRYNVLDLYVNYIRLNMKMSVEDKNRLEKCYPGMQIKFSDDKAYREMHCYSHADRLVGRQYILRLIGYGNTEMKGYDYMVVDVGGRITQCISRHDVNIHVEQPVLTAHDSQRLANDLTTINSIITRNQRKVAGNGKRDYSLVMALRAKEYYIRCSVATRGSAKYDDSQYPCDGQWCYRRSQCCPTTAYAAMFLHSAYDMTTVEIADIMVTKKSVVGYMMMYFSEAMYTDLEGTIAGHNVRWVIFKINGKTFVRFSFVDDPSNCYTHEYETYISKFTNTIYTSSTGVSYPVEIISTFDGVYLFRITRMVDLPIKDEFTPITRVMNTHGVDKEQIVISYFELQPCTVTGKQKFKTNFLTVQKSVYESVCSFLMKTSTGRFTPENTIRVAAAYNSNITIDNKEIVRKQNLTAKEVMVIAHAAYIQMTVLKNEHKETSKALLEHHQNIKDFNDRSFIYRFIYKFMTSLLGNRHPILVRDAKSKGLNVISDIYSYATLQDRHACTDDTTAIEGLNAYFRLQNIFAVTTSAACPYITVSSLLFRNKVLASVADFFPDSDGSVNLTDITEKFLENMECVNDFIKKHSDIGITMPQSTFDYKIDELRRALRGTFDLKSSSGSVQLPIPTPAVAIPQVVETHSEKFLKWHKSSGLPPIDPKFFEGEAAEEVFEVRTTGDGDCALHAMCLLLTGEEVKDKRSLNMDTLRQLMVSYVQEATNSGDIIPCSSQKFVAELSISHTQLTPAVFGYFSKLLEINIRVLIDAGANGTSFSIFYRGDVNNPRRYVMIRLFSHHYTAIFPSYDTTKTITTMSSSLFKPVDYAIINIPAKVTLVGNTPLATVVENHSESYSFDNFKMVRQKQPVNKLSGGFIWYIPMLISIYSFFVSMYMFIRDTASGYVSLRYFLLLLVRLIVMWFVIDYSYLSFLLFIATLFPPNVMMNDGVVTLLSKLFIFWLPFISLYLVFYAGLTVNVVCYFFLLLVGLFWTYRLLLPSKYFILTISVGFIVAVGAINLSGSVVDIKLPNYPTVNYERTSYLDVVRDRFITVSDITNDEATLSDGRGVNVGEVSVNDYSIAGFATKYQTLSRETISMLKLLRFERSTYAHYYVVDDTTSVDEFLADLKSLYVSSTGVSRRRILDMTSTIVNDMGNDDPGIFLDYVKDVLPYEGMLVIRDAQNLSPAIFEVMHYLMDEYMDSIQGTARFVVFMAVFPDLSAMGRLQIYDRLRGIYSTTIIADTLDPLLTRITYATILELPHSRADDLKKMRSVYEDENKVVKYVIDDLLDLGNSVIDVALNGLETSCGFVFPNRVYHKWIDILYPAGFHVCDPLDFIFINDQSYHRVSLLQLLFPEGYARCSIVQGNVYSDKQLEREDGLQTLSWYDIVFPHGLTCMVVTETSLVTYDPLENILYNWFESFINLCRFIVTFAQSCLFLLSDINIRFDFNVCSVILCFVMYLLMFLMYYIRLVNINSNVRFGSDSDDEFARRLASHFDCLFIPEFLFKTEEERLTVSEQKFYSDINIIRGFIQHPELNGVEIEDITNDIVNLNSVPTVMVSVHNYQLHDDSEIKIEEAITDVASLYTIPSVMNMEEVEDITNDDIVNLNSIPTVMGESVASVHNCHLYDNGDFKIEEIITDVASLYTTPTVINMVEIEDTTNDIVDLSGIPTVMSESVTSVHDYQLYDNSDIKIEEIITDVASLYTIPTVMRECIIHEPNYRICGDDDVVEGFVQQPVLSTFELDEVVSDMNYNPPSKIDENVADEKGSGSDFVFDIDFSEYIGESVIYDESDDVQLIREIQGSKKLDDADRIEMDEFIKVMADSEEVIHDDFVDVEEENDIVVVPKPAPIATNYVNSICKFCRTDAPSSPVLHSSIDLTLSDVILHPVHNYTRAADNSKKAYSGFAGEVMKMTRSYVDILCDAKEHGTGLIDGKFVVTECNVMNGKAVCINVIATAYDYVDTINNTLTYIDQQLIEELDVFEDNDSDSEKLEGTDDEDVPDVIYTLSLPFVGGGIYKKLANMTDDDVIENLKRIFEHSQTLKYLRVQFHVADLRLFDDLTNCIYESDSEIYSFVDYFLLGKNVYEIVVTSDNDFSNCTCLYQIDDSHFSYTEGDKFINFIPGDRYGRAVATINSLLQLNNRFVHVIDDEGIGCFRNFSAFEVKGTSSDTDNFVVDSVNIDDCKLHKSVFSTGCYLSHICYSDLDASEVIKYTTEKFNCVLRSKTVTYMDGVKSFVVPTENGENVLRVIDKKCVGLGDVLFSVLFAVASAEDIPMYVPKNYRVEYVVYDKELQLDIHHHLISSGLLTDEYSKFTDIRHNEKFLMVDKNIRKCVVNAEKMLVREAEPLDRFYNASVERILIGQLEIHNQVTKYAGYFETIIRYLPKNLDRYTHNQLYDIFNPLFGKKNPLGKEQFCIYDFYEGNYIFNSAHRSLRNPEYIYSHGIGPDGFVIIDSPIPGHEVVKFNHGTPQEVHALLNKPGFVKDLHKYDVRPVSGSSIYTDKLHRDRYLIVFESLRTFVEPQIIKAIHSQLGNVFISAFPAITLIEGVPGCGKTTRAVKNFSDSGMVLCSTRAAVADVASRVRASIEDDSGWVTGASNYLRIKKCVRTTDSLIINGHDKSIKVKELVVDEALMRHPGEILTIALLVQPATMRLIGDTQQIPYVNRTSLRLRYGTLDLSVSEHLNVSYRCPTDVIARVGSMYNYSVFSADGSRGTVSWRQVSSFAGMELLKLDYKNTVVLVFLQDEKRHLKEYYKRNNVDVDVHTVHEFQGNQSDNVLVIRVPGFSVLSTALFWKKPYALVAITRHRKSFRYLTPFKDALTELCEKNINDDELNLFDYVPDRLKGGGDYVGELSMLTIYNSDLIQKPANKEIDDIIDEIVNNNVVMERLPQKLFDINSELVKAQTPYTDDLREERINFACVYEHQNIQDDISTIQHYVDYLCPSNAFVVNDLDQYIVESSDTTLFLGSDVTITNAYVVVPDKEYDYLSPVLHTTMFPTRNKSLKSFLNGLYGRNACVPELVGDVDQGSLGIALFENLKSVFKSDVMTADMEKLEIGISQECIKDWYLSTRSSELYYLREGLDFEFYADGINRYDFSIKPQLKPSYSVGCESSYPTPQTITAHAKNINIITCSMVRQLKDRIKAVLPDNLLMYMDMSSEDFVAEMNKRFPTSAYKLSESLKFSKYELDISKYDKSQALCALVFECEMLKYFGMPLDFVNYWFDFHKYGVLVGRIGGLPEVSFKSMYQRKSGEAMTLLGNTMFTIAVLLCVYDYDDIRLMVVAGDDSVVFCKSHFDNNTQSSEILATLMNLETKEYSYKYVYFCGRYLLSGVNTWYFIPDPVKFMIKLGRSDVMDYDHLEEYRISSQDNFSSLYNVEALVMLEAAVAERVESIVCHSWNIRMSVIPAILSIKNLLSKSLRDLFVTRVGHVFPHKGVKRPELSDSYSASRGFSFDSVFTDNSD